MTAVMQITNKLNKIMLPIVVLLLSGACSIRYFMPVEGTLTEERFAVVRTDSLQIAIRPQSYLGNYQDINSRFFPVFVRIKNISGNKIKISESSFGILAKEKQFDPVPLQYILANLRQNFLLNDFNDPFNPSDPVQETLDRNREQDMYFELVNAAFSYGEILPGGIKEGYLFYNRALSSADSFSIDAVGHRLSFIKR
jgi:hypothetical protein